MLTIAEMFDAVIDHFSQPDAEYSIEKDDDGYPVCVYRGNHNPASKLRCGVGVLIPDSEYDDGMEGKTLYALRNSPNYRHVVENLFGAQSDTNSVQWVAERIQGLHDRYAINDGPMGDFVSALREMRYEICTA